MSAQQTISKQMLNQRICIGVATHKPYIMPPYVEYVPVQVGAALNAKINSFVADDDGLNISKENPYFSELTALYFIWKNSSADYKGIVHYRRYLSDASFFARQKKRDFHELIHSDRLAELLEKTDVVLPQRRRYYIESNRNHYAHAHSVKDLDQVRQIIASDFPEYTAAFDLQMRSESAHMFNMFIMRNNYFDGYCEWLFAVLFKLQEQIEYRHRSSQEARVFGYVSELLLDVWINTNAVKYRELPVYYLEGQQVFKKGLMMLQRKIKGKGNAHIESK